jgi:hypothetical protein
MKYMILTYGSQLDYAGMSGAAAGREDGAPVWTPADFAAMTEFMRTFAAELEESGELVETRGLAAPAITRRVQLRDGVPVVTDGPYAETTEVLAGYWVVECASFDRATEIAARLSTCPAPEGLAETAVADVRPIMESAAELAM